MSELDNEVEKPMNESRASSAQSLREAYDAQYTDTMTDWREVCAKYKAQNILDVCEGHKFGAVLEYGAGEGSILAALDASAAFDELYALEISNTGIEQIQKRKIKRLRDVKRFDGYATPYADKRFDMVYSSHVIEHVEHPRLVLREIRRISRYQVFEIPTEYAPNVDQKMAHFLAYGHISIYTPSLFRFLLKSEGFKILYEISNHTPMEVVRFNWYRNKGWKKSPLTELALAAYPLRHALNRVRLGEDGFREQGFDTYTCLAEGVSDLKVF